MKDGKHLFTYRVEAETELDMVLMFPQGEQSDIDLKVRFVENDIDGNGLRREVDGVDGKESYT